jgi:hypothetical protein
MTKSGKHIKFDLDTLKNSLDVEKLGVSPWPGTVKYSPNCGLWVPEYRDQLVVEPEPRDILVPGFALSDFDPTATGLTRKEVLNNFSAIIAPESEKATRLQIFSLPEEFAKALKRGE